MAEHPTFSGIENFRDFGGAPSTLGGHVRTGRLFRSAHLGAATPADIATLEQLGITTSSTCAAPASEPRIPRAGPVSPGA